VLNVVMSAVRATRKPQDGHLSQCSRPHIQDHTVGRIPDLWKYSGVLVSLKDDALPSYCGLSLAPPPLMLVQQTQLAQLCLAWSLPAWMRSILL